MVSTNRVDLSRIVINNQTSLRASIFKFLHHTFGS